MTILRVLLGRAGVLCIVLCTGEGQGENSLDVPTKGKVVVVGPFKLHLNNALLFDLSLRSKLVLNNALLFASQSSGKNLILAAAVVWFSSILTKNNYLGASLLQKVHF